jgi:hypothetical protein
MPFKSLRNEEFKTFEKQFPKTVEMLNGIIDKEPRGVGLEKIFKMVASRDEKIRVELIAADYFVKTLKAIGVTEKIVLSLEKEMPTIIERTNEIVSQLQLQQSASKNKTGGQPRVNIWAIILFLLIVQYLLTQIPIPPDGLAGIQRTITTESDRIRREIDTNCSDPGNPTYCQENLMYLDIYHRLFRFIRYAEPNLFNMQNLIGFETMDLLIQNMPMTTIIVAIIVIMNYGALYLTLRRVIPAMERAMQEQAELDRAAQQRQEDEELEKLEKEVRMRKESRDKRDKKGGGSRRRRCSKRCKRKRHHRTQTKR